MTGPIGRLLEPEAFPLSAGAGASPLVVVNRSLKVAGSLRPPSGKISVFHNRPDSALYLFGDYFDCRTVINLKRSALVSISSQRNGF